MHIISIAAWLARNNVSEADLDDVVIDASCKLATPNANATNSAASQEAVISNAEQTASDVNNDGMDAQIAFLTRVYGSAEDVAAVISEALDIPSALAA